MIKPGTLRLTAKPFMLHKVLPFQRLRPTEIVLNVCYYGADFTPVPNVAFSPSEFAGGLNTLVAHVAGHPALCDEYVWARACPLENH